MSPECQNCGAHVSEDYVRVFSRDDDSVRACTHCEDMVREADGTVRPARAHRGGDGSDPVEYDPALATDGGQR